MEAKTNLQKMTATIPLTDGEQAAVDDGQEHVVRQHYPEAARLLITADSGGPDGSRLRLLKTELATLAAQTGLEITVAHFPPGPSPARPSGTKSSTGCSASSS